jgi:hypothetical protein
VRRNFDLSSDSLAPACQPVLDAKPLANIQVDRNLWQQPQSSRSILFTKLKLSESTSHTGTAIAMGRFETLNDDTKDLVECLLPALATSFGLSKSLDIIPEDIRMRAWDCERRDHIKDQTENDPRNWGVQFLKDLKAIARLKNGDLAAFQADLYAKVALHEPKHPWCRLTDIRELKDEYEHPERKNQVVTVESSEESSEDSYFEELVEPDQPRGGKKRRTNHEIYEARVLEKRRKRKSTPSVYLSSPNKHIFYHCRP